MMYILTYLMLKQQLSEHNGDYDNKVFLSASYSWYIWTLFIPDTSARKKGCNITGYAVLPDFTGTL